MPRGGSRVRSGPDPDPNSGRSERTRRRAAAAKKTAAKKAPTAKKTTATTAAKKTASTVDASGSITTSEFNPLALPARGRAGRPPAFPLPKIIRFIAVLNADGKAAKQADAGASNAFRNRELEVWAELWKTPQAVAWEREPYRWPTIAKYCRIMVSTEAEPDASAALLSRERELRIECGLSADGLKANGWAIAPDEMAAKRATKKRAAKKAAEYPPLRLQK